jgi:UDP-GlcNAc:undecaprenyl-phosphate/decaprenyl-phosphate GlcNAc-1-phosphate transferase
MITFVITLVATFSVALIASLLLTPLVRRLAIERGFVDRPDGRRKMQKTPVALGGGSAVLGALLLGVALLSVLWVFHDIRGIENLRPLVGLFSAAILICVVGLYDDLWEMRGRTKLFWQLGAAAVVTFAGPRIEHLSLFGHEFEIGHFGALLALFWLLASINSFNLIDGVDGLASSVGVIFSFAFGTMALMQGQELDAVIAFILAGALLGFLRFNFAPASIYLGDAGSMIIGLVLGALALRSGTKEAATVAFAAPLGVWAIPMLDSLAAVLRRKLTGRSIYVTDRGHIHHRLLTQGMTTRQAVALISGLCLVTSLGSLAGIYFASEWIGVVTVLVVLGALITTRLFGHVELMLLNRRLLGIGRSIVSGGDEKPSQTTHRLQGSLQWEEKIWNALVESAERFSLTRIRLNLYLPHLHEDFYATWRGRAAGPATKVWRVELPLVAEGMAVGYLHVTGNQDPRTASAQLASFLDFIEPLEAQIVELLSIQPTPLTPQTESARTDLPARLSQSPPSSAEPETVVLPRTTDPSFEPTAR